MAVCVIISRAIPISTAWLILEHIAVYARKIESEPRIHFVRNLRGKHVVVGRHEVV